MLNKIGIDWLGNFFALTATFLMATKTMAPGFSLLLCANITFIIFGIKTKQYSFLVFNILFALNSLYGIYRWL
jgi:hypothetical protein